MKIKLKLALYLEMHCSYCMSDHVIFKTWRWWV